MAYIVRRDQTLLRAFPSYEEAVNYRQVKQHELHDHCCVCHNCPNISYYKEHDHANYSWMIHSVAVDSPQVKNKLYIVYPCSHYQIKEEAFVSPHKTAFATYREARDYQKEMDDEWLIVTCNYGHSSFVDDEKLTHDKHGLYNEL